MQLLLSAIAAGGLVGASNQYLCLLFVSIAAKIGLITLDKPMEFMKEWWFIGIVALFWLLTVAPAYATFLGPGIMHIINTFSNFISGFLVPLSGAIFSLAAAGIIADMNPTLRNLLMTLRLFNPGGGIGTHGYIVASGGALLASLLNIMRFLSKPGLGYASGTAGTLSAPVYASAENLASVVFLALIILLARINPWLLVALVAIVALFIVGIFIFSIIMLWKMGRGIGKFLRLIKTDPKAGLAIALEAIVWGSGWLIRGNLRRGLFLSVLWLVWLALVLLLIPGTFTGIGAVVEIILVIAGIYKGLRGAAKLLEQIAPAPAQ